MVVGIGAGDRVPVIRSAFDPTVDRATTLQLWLQVLSIVNRSFGNEGVKRV